MGKLSSYLVADSLDGFEVPVFKAGISRSNRRAPVSLFGLRTKLSTSRIYYVAPGGNDANDGLSSGNAFATLQKALDTYSQIDLNGQAVTIQVADGTYAGAILRGTALGASAALPLTIQGNIAAPANCVLSGVNNNCFVARDGARAYITGFKLTTAGSGDCLLADNGGEITYGAIEFGACAGFHKEANDHSRIYNNGNYSISGGAVAHEHCNNLAYILNLLATVTLIGVPAFSSFYCGVAGAFIQYVGTAFVGTATGPRYLIHENGILEATGQLITYLPGSTAGTVDSGGCYSSVGGTAYLNSGPQWSTSNYGLTLALGGPRHNAIGIRDALGANPWAIANVSGVLTFSQMEAFYGVAAAPTQRLELMASGTVKQRGFTVANLPAAPTAGETSYATNGRKNAEGAGAGTGVPVFADSTGAWISYCSGLPVTA